MVKIPGDNKQTVGSSAEPDMECVLVQTPVHSFRASKLEDRVRDLERLLRKANKECKQQKEIFQQKEMTLKESLANAQLKHQTALETISQLEEEKSVLINLVNTLFSREQDLGVLCHLSYPETDELQTHSAWMLENKMMRKNVMHNDEMLKVSLADAELKHQKALVYISQLEEEKSELTERVNTLRSTVQELGEELYDTHLQSDELQIELEQQLKAHSALLLEYEEMKELTHKEGVLKVPLADELKHQKALESITQLEEEKSELTNLVKKLRFVIQDLGEELCNCNLEIDELQIDYEQTQAAHSALLLENEEMKKELMHKDKVLKVSLADAELKHQKALKTISQLEEEKSELTKQVYTLRSTVQKLGEELCHSHLQSDKLQLECGQHRSGPNEDKHKTV